MTSLVRPKALWDANFASLHGLWLGVHGLSLALSHTLDIMAPFFLPQKCPLHVCLGRPAQDSDRGSQEYIPVHISAPGSRRGRRPSLHMVFMLRKVSQSLVAWQLRPPRGLSDMMIEWLS